MNKSIIRIAVISLLVSLVVSFLAVVTAPIHSLFLLQRYCPEGSQIHSTTDRASYQGPTDSTLFVYCEYPDGQRDSLGDVNSAALFGTYFVFFFLVVFLVQYVWARRNRPIPRNKRAYKK